MKTHRINGRTVHYDYKVVLSDAPVLVFANSLGTDLRVWDLVIDALPSTYNILRIDKPGHGLSEPAGDTSSAENLAADMIAVLDCENIQSAVFVGLSIGGLIVQEVYRLRPDLVEKLVLTNTASKLGSKDAWNDRIKAIQADGLDSIVDSILMIWFASNFRTEFPDRFAVAKCMLVQTNDEGYLAACTALRDADLRAAAQAIKVPTLCIAGSDDLATPEAVVKEMADNIPNAEFALLSDVGHIPCLEDPKTFCKVLLDFIGD